MRFLHTKKPAYAPSSDECASLLNEFKSQVPQDVLANLHLTGEIPSLSRTDVDFVLLRYLRAEKYDVHKALERLVKHVQWRLEHLSKGRIADSDVAHSIAQQKVFLQLPTSKHPHPLLIVKGANHLPVPIAETEHYITYCLEAASKLCTTVQATNTDTSQGKMFALMDVGNIHWKNLDAAALRASFGILNTHYPERMLTVFMLNANFLFDGLWRAVSPLLDPVSRSKVQFVYTPRDSQLLVDRIGKDVLPREYGGEAEAVPIARQVSLLSNRMHDSVLTLKEETSEEDDLFYDAHDEHNSL